MLACLVWLLCTIFTDKVGRFVKNGIFKISFNLFDIDETIYRELSCAITSPTDIAKITLNVLKRVLPTTYSRYTFFVANDIY